MNRTPSRLWDFPSAVILVLVLLTAGQRLFVTHWAAGLGTVLIFILIGVVLGMSLGYSIFKQRAVYWFTFGYSIPIFLLVLGWILYSGNSWLERVADLSDRLAYSIGLFIAKQPVLDTTMFVIFIALVFWMIGLMAGYAMTRFGNFFAAVVPAGVVLVIIQLYDSGIRSRDNLLAIYFILCLLLLGRLTYVQRRHFWKEQRVSILAESRTDLNVTLAVVAITTVLLVWLAPTSLKSFSDVKTAWENFTHPLRRVQQDLGKAVAGIQGSGKAKPVQFFGDILPLGGQAATGNTVYLRIQTPPVKNTVRYYWRVRSYNVFLNDQWYAENDSSKPFTKDQAYIPIADPEGSTDIFAFTALSVDLASLVTPARPVWVSSPSELYFLQAPQGKMDPIQFSPDPPVLVGQQYLVRADVFDPTVVQLRSAGVNYPAWVTSHYLQLPDSISPGIIDLAQQITGRGKIPYGASYENPYDMVVAITSYLRGNITYSSVVGNPPAGRDPIDWFLFDSKSGFCNYYATAEVLLLRAVGIPARMVVGFAQGELEPPDQYVVRQRDSHAWPEVYFPDIGWVEFEPTTNQAPLTRPEGESSAPDGHFIPTPIESDVVPHNIRGKSGEKVTTPVEATSANLLLRLILIWLIIVTILQMFTFGTFDNILKADQRTSMSSLPARVNHFLEKRALRPPVWLLHWEKLAELNPVERSFMTIYRSLHWLGRKTSPAQTPAEAAGVLAGDLPYASPEIYSLLHEYEHQIYSQKHGYLLLTRRAVKVIRRETLRAVIQQRWRALRGILRLGAG